LRHLKTLGDVPRTEFLSDFGVRATSQFHEQHPYKFRLNGTELAVSYLPGESDPGRVWRKLQLAKPDLVPPKLSIDRIAAAISPLLWR
jgi:hypothetical protein